MTMVIYFGERNQHFYMEFFNYIYILLTNNFKTVSYAKAHY